jgi:polysaccharide biosynthesis/export protein
MFKLSSAGIALAITLLVIGGALTAQVEPKTDEPKTDEPRTENSARPPAEISDASQPRSDRPTLQQRHPRYRVMRNDVLNISFPLSPEFNRQSTVQPDGYINLQSAESVYVQGMTVPEIEAAIKQAYSPVLHQPIINVDLADFQKPFFIVGGQVGKPGQYDLRHDMTVSQGIAVSGGLTASAKTQIFLFRRVSPDMVEVKKLNLKDIYHGKNANEDAQLQPGDTLFVPETFISNFKKYVPYSVGTYIDPSSMLH